MGMKSEEKFVFEKTVDTDSIKLVEELTESVAKFQKNCDNRKIVYDGFGLGDKYDEKRAIRKVMNALQKKFEEDMAAQEILYAAADEPLKEVRKKKAVNGKLTSKFDVAMEEFTKAKLPGRLEALESIKAIKSEAVRTIQLSNSWDECRDVVNDARANVNAIQVE